MSGSRNQPQQSVWCVAGDGRHLLSNAKDQTAKLWDLRRMLSAAQHARLPPARTPNFEWDYRCAHALCRLIVTVSPHALRRQTSSQARSQG